MQNSPVLKVTSSSERTGPLFRNLATLSQKAGVTTGSLPRLVAKELADNALDESGSCRVGRLGDDGFFVEDDGGGIPGNDPELAALFSIRRPLTSSKLLRLPTRGALGNGLRVVAGSVLASGGTLVVATRGRKLRLVPQDDGGTTAMALGACPAIGTRIEVRFGHPLVVDDETLAWAEYAILLSQGGPKYAGKTSPHWYDPDGFFELLQASGRRTVRELIAEFDGCTEPKAGKIASEFKGRPQPGQIRRREGWWQTVRNVVSYLQSRGGEAMISKADQYGLGGSPPRVKAILDALVSAGILHKGRRQYARPTTYSLVKSEASGSRHVLPSP